MVPGEEMIRMFTDENTTGYTAAELAALNAELAARLAEIPEDNTDARNAAEKAFADEVSRR
jgi:hypothetical protein